MINKRILRSYMARHGDTQADLANALGCKRVWFSTKLNERRGASFTKSEMDIIRERYHMSTDDFMACFFATEVS